MTGYVFSPSWMLNIDHRTEPRVFHPTTVLVAAPDPAQAIRAVTENMPDFRVIGVATPVTSPLLIPVEAPLPDD